METLYWPGADADWQARATEAKAEAQRAKQKQTLIAQKSADELAKALSAEQEKLKVAGMRAVKMAMQRQLKGFLGVILLKWKTAMKHEVSVESPAMPSPSENTDKWRHHSAHSLEHP